MKVIGAKLGELGMMITLLSLVHMVSCEDRLDTSRPSVNEGERVEVSLCVGFADEVDGASPASIQDSQTKSGSSIPAFEVKPVSHGLTKSPIEGDKPDKLYGLQILQYTKEGDFMRVATLGDVSIGSSLTTTLNTQLTASEDCQLFIIARGLGNTVPAFTNSSTNASWQKLQETVANASVINELTNVNAMPYFLYLPHVCIERDATNTSQYHLRNDSGSGSDVRLLLKRLAVHLTVSWNFSSSMTDKKYVLKEVKLCQIPKKYFIYPAHEEDPSLGEIYPNSVVEYYDPYRLTSSEALSAGMKTVWMPANVKGISSRVTSTYYRNKDYAHSAATYMEFVVDNAERQERLYYRAYLGGKSVSDFNLRENTNYHWTVNINTADYVGDPRIQLLDQTPVTSDNLVPTANCFMMRPGTNICFNPYKHTAGTNGWNDQLVNTPSGTPVIKSKIGSVKVLWQTKDAGTAGDLVLGYVIDNKDHRNLVNLTGDGIDQTRVNVKVPITQGGNAVIAAYDESGSTILWSWHIWITNYQPVGISASTDYKAAQAASKPGTVHQYDSPLFASGGVYERKVVMDRDLGARAGGFPYFTTGKKGDFTTMDAVKTYGLLYQWGRKDPFFTSMDGSNEEKDIIYDGYGISKGVEKISSSTDAVQVSIKNPLHFMTGWSSYWSSLSASGNPWNKSTDNKAPGIKTIQDPCPTGWKMPMMFDSPPSSGPSWNEMQEHSMFTNFANIENNNGNGFNNQNNNANYNYTRFLFFFQGQMLKNARNLSDSRFGRVFFIGLDTSTDLAGRTIDDTVWIPATAERSGGNLAYGGQYGHFWGADVHNKGGMFFGFRNYDCEMYGYSVSLGWPVRCIQDQ